MAEAGETARERIRSRVWILVAPFLLILVGCGAPTEYDLILRGGTIVDGSGGASYEGDLAVTGDRIAAVGDIGRAVAPVEIDASGLVVAPGFIHLHSHATPEGVAAAENMLTQGVTTEILGPDGGGPWDLDAAFELFTANGLAVNIGGFVGFNRVWSEVMGPDDRRASAADIEAMQDLVIAGLNAGAWGVSAGLDYKPAYFATTEEVIEVLRPAGEWGAGRWSTIFTNHDRLTPESGFSSRVGMEETVEIGLETGLQPVITHMKIQGREQGTGPDVIRWMTETSAAGTPVAADVYPYLAGQTSLAALIIPGWAQAGGRDAMLGRFADAALRTRIVEEAEEAMDARFDGPSGVYLLSTRRELTDVMSEMGVRAGEAVVRLLEQDSHGVILRFGAEEDLVRILQHPTASVSCDCGASTSDRIHPRYWGTHPRVLGHYVREQGVLTLEEAIRKMTSLPAETIGLDDRGRLAPGLAADLVVFDPETVIDHATYENPIARSEGIVYVWVNGAMALSQGDPTGEQGGRVIRRAAPTN